MKSVYFYITIILASLLCITFNKKGKGKGKGKGKDEEKYEDGNCDSCNTIFQSCSDNYDSNVNACELNISSPLSCDNQFRYEYIDCVKDQYDCCFKCNGSIPNTNNELCVPNPPLPTYRSITCVFPPPTVGPARGKQPVIKIIDGSVSCQGVYDYLGNCVSAYDTITGKQLSCNQTNPTS